jgi:Fe-S cluster assembly ATPase SufC
MKVLGAGTWGSGKSTVGRLLWGDERCRFIEADTDTYQGRSLAFYRSRFAGEGLTASHGLSRKSG